MAVIIEDAAEAALSGFSDYGRGVRTGPVGTTVSGVEIPETGRIVAGGLI